MKSDSAIQRDVEQELQSDPEIDASDIAVAVKDGVVTLSGFVHSASQKQLAERAAKRVAGVIAVANDIVVRLPVLDTRPGPGIARDVVQAIRDALPDTWENIQVTVADGVVTLEGEVEWNYQREAAKGAAIWVDGVRHLRNRVAIKPRTAPADIKRQIEEALRRQADINASHITVEATGGYVILKGTVRSWTERKAAERAAWQAPGVREVENRLVVSRFPPAGPHDQPWLINPDATPGTGALPPPDSTHQIDPAVA
jgi:osmotically-inducible protein OsmY